MIPGEFARRLKKLNPSLRVFAGNDDTKPAGLFMVIRGEYEQICSVDKNFIPRRLILDEKNHIIKSGWNRVLKLLINKKLINKKKAEKLFGPIHFNLPSFRDIEDKVEKELKYVENKNSYKNGFDKNGKPILTRNAVMEMSEAIRGEK